MKFAVPAHPQVRISKAVSALLRQVVTFARDPRRGNAAFVLGVEAFPAAGPLATACELLGCDVLAVGERPQDPEPALRFVTPAGPHAGAGHAALAAAHLALRAAPPGDAFISLPASWRHSSTR